MKDVPRIGRILDLAGLLLFLAGAGCYTRAWFGFQSLPEHLPDPNGELWAAVQIADGFLGLQRLGVGLMLAGMAVFVVAWWMARRRASTE